MIVHRFMSDKEYQALVAGETLKNDTIHAKNGQKSRSVGFCFFTEPPEDAIHWLSFIATTDWCVTLDIPDQLLRESKARYRDPEHDSFEHPASIWRKEWCLKQYSTSTARIVNASDQWRGYEEKMMGSLFAFFGQMLFGL